MTAFVKACNISAVIPLEGNLLSGFVLFFFLLPGEERALAGEDWNDPLALAGEEA